ncbi:hypothetical protein B0T26DRAFT_745672 [Lasiosphaeria miniovina]|uniref:Uncharacterized protein n=1 Tax=Lasiosphaeria miniovina TaxID=1954250 RepID=A0AA40BG61_9PEZI|nr:uncharacterized protein B0T26DRAFT_745672 [Lasiosphaeria miniovina]KAK0733648.1 hypothetical protein B0T26DRAFT_745672 [Lasiosphaeria miniovina]
MDTTQEKKPTSAVDGGRMKEMADDVKQKFQAFTANPGPAIKQDLNVPEEGTKEERRAKAAELNSK